MSDILFAPTKNNVENLKKENIQGEIYLTGNTIVDALKIIKLKLSKKRPFKEDYILVTLHRREAFGKPMKEMLEALKELSKIIKIVFPAHLNPNLRKGIRESKIEIIEPVNYLKMLWYMKHCKLILSDSGGLQEEAPSFNKPILILRQKTERSEIIESGQGKLIGWNKKRIIKETYKLLTNDNEYKLMISKENPFGDSQASERILKILNNYET